MKKLAFLLLLSLVPVRRVKAVITKGQATAVAVVAVGSTAYAVVAVGSAYAVVAVGGAYYALHSWASNTENLFEAVRNGGYWKTRILIAAGANLEATDQYGYTALHLAAQSGNTETAIALLESGANHNATNKFGDTPLHLAANHGHTETVRILLVYGAQPRNISSLNPQIATMIARYRGTQTENEVKLHGAPGSLKQLAALKTLKKLYLEHNSDTQAIRNAVNELHIDGDSKNTLLYWLGDSIQA